MKDRLVAIILLTLFYCWMGFAMSMTDPAKMQREWNHVERQVI